MIDSSTAGSAEAGRSRDQSALGLAESLRRRGNLEDAAQVVIHRLERSPNDADAHDLYARVLADMGNIVGAESEWYEVLEHDPKHAGAHKGLGFLRYRERRYDDALEHLESALEAAPTDPSIVRALETVRGAVQREARTEPDTVFEGLEGAGRGLLLADDRGGVLGGVIRRPGGDDRSQEVAGAAAQVVEESRRTAAMTRLGDWEWAVVEGEEGSVYVAAPTERSVLCIVRDRGVPAARLAFLAEAAIAAARHWLSEQRL